ncbi:MAG: hypothetical protein JWQ66_286 [Mucilaginibacter sp.]|nr:hypothetical protein [Mucilaginibacter sp.]
MLKKTIKLFVIIALLNGCTNGDKANKITNKRQTDSCIELKIGVCVINKKDTVSIISLR